MGVRHHVIATQADTDYFDFVDDVVQVVVIGVAVVYVSALCVI